MNKRLRELIQEAIDTNDKPNNGYTFPVERFAELIVRECARVAIEKQTENDLSGVVSENPARDFALALVERFEIGKQK